MTALLELQWPLAQEPLPWATIFDQQQKIKVEIGPGKGEFLLEQAQKEPGFNFVGLELRWIRALKIANAADKANLQNIKIIAIDAKTYLKYLFPASSIFALFIHFPDPWPKNRHQQRRLLGPEFLPAIHHVLAPEGNLYCTTDVPWYNQHIEQTFKMHAGFEVIYHHQGSAIPLQYHQTQHELKFKACGKTIFYFCFKRKK